MTKVQCIEADVMLLGWSETHSGGAKITLQLADVAQLEPFKRMTLKKGKIAGQLLTAVFVEHDGNGNPVAPDDGQVVKYDPKTGITTVDGPPQSVPYHGKARFPTGYCGLAVKWSGEPSFAQWLVDAFPATYGACITLLGDANGEAPIGQVGAWCIKKLCGVESRKELDTDDRARAAFDVHIRKPYSAHRRELGLDEG